jgi:[CysO sulfur-carrier protein]-S-L-cysteine hydrolase
MARLPIVSPAIRYNRYSRNARQQRSDSPSDRQSGRKKFHKIFRLGRLYCLMELVTLSISLQLHLPRRFYEAMLQHAQAERPNECCGLLAGMRDGDVMKVAAWYPLVNEAASPTEYQSEPHSMFRAIKDMRKAGHDILAIYHSHPTSAPTPSRTDLARNYSPDVINFIISLAGQQPLLHGWWLTEDAFDEATWSIVDM